MKAIEGYEGLYSATEDGFIYSHIFNRILSKKSKGYVCMRLCKDGKQKPIRVHQLIAQTFIPNPNNYPDINHKNGIKFDNRVENLEWCTRSFNITHSFRELGRLPVVGKHHPKYRPILDLQTGIFYESSTEAAVAKGLTRDMLLNSMKRRCRFGFIWA